MKLVTWNTQWCCGLDGAVSPQRIVDGARALADFDVLCLQEIAHGYAGMPGAPGDQPAQLAALLPGFQLFFGAAVDEFSSDGTRERFGNLIATRLPVLQVQHHPLPWPADAGRSSMPRMCTVLTLRDPRLGDVRVMTTHLEYYSAVQRLAQAHALCALHAEACARAAAPPADDDPESPFRAKVQHLAGYPVRRLQPRSQRSRIRAHQRQRLARRLAAGARQASPRADLPPVRPHLRPDAHRLRLRLRQRQPGVAGHGHRGGWSHAGQRPCSTLALHIG